MDVSAFMVFSTWIRCSLGIAIANPKPSGLLSALSSSIVLVGVTLGGTTQNTHIIFSNLYDYRTSSSIGLSVENVSFMIRARLGYVSTLALTKPANLSHDKLLSLILTLRLRVYSTEA